MRSSLRVAPAEKVKAAIARLVLEDVSRTPRRLGRIELQPHQQSAILRIRSAIEEFGGAILSDPVGTGKTFIAVAVAPADASLAVVAPAVLRQMWVDAFNLCERAGEFVSFESLSRGAILKRDYDFVIVDEAHHARNPATRRFRMLSQLVANTPVLLVTATPIHNRRSDLTALISLFHGERAEHLTFAELSRLLVRRDDLSRSIPGMPRTRSLTTLRVPENHRIPELLLALPPPVPVRDGRDGGALIAHSLIREWASSDAALIGGLKRRLVRAESLSAALADGTWPSRAELISWIAGDSDVQLGFAGLLAPAVSHTGEMIQAIAAHSNAIRSLLEAVRTSPSDHERADLIRQVRFRNGGRRIVAFSQYADTIEGLFRIISRDGKVGALTGSGARVAGGTLSRLDAIAAFAPRASRQNGPRPSDEITLLLTTDLLSEGVNLQDAGVVIHLDLPWTPARMEQRLGRVARIGSVYDDVDSYAIFPPIGAEDAIRIEGILRTKVEESSLVVTDWSALAGLDLRQPTSVSTPQINEAARSSLSHWLVPEPVCCSSIAAGAAASRDGFLAVIEHRGFNRVVATVSGRIGSDAPLIVDCLEAVISREVSIDEAVLLRCEKEAVDWIASNHALPSSYESPIRNRAAREVRRIVSRARAFQRMEIAHKADRALGILGGNLGAFEESIIESALQDGDGATLLDRIITLRRSTDVIAATVPKVLAMLILVSE